VEIIETEPYLKARVEKFNEAKPKMTKHFKSDNLDFERNGIADYSAFTKPT
jgi:hypothetical protein